MSRYLVVGGGKVLPGLLALVRAVVELGEAEVAVGDERTPERCKELHG